MNGAMLAHDDSRMLSASNIQQEALIEKDERDRHAVAFIFFQIVVIRPGGGRSNGYSAALRLTAAERPRSVAIS
jgi:hypothetical protein